MFRRQTLLFSWLLASALFCLGAQPALAQQKAPPPARTQYQDRLNRLVVKSDQHLKLRQQKYGPQHKLTQSQQRRHQNLLKRQVMVNANPYLYSLAHGQIQAQSPKVRMNRIHTDSKFVAQALPYAINPVPPKGAPPAQILSFKSPSLENAQGKPRWHGPGDLVRFEMVVRYSGDGRKLPFQAAVHTNANQNADPNKWQDYPMSFLSQKGDKVTLAVDLPIEHIGNYRAAGVLVKDRQALAWSGGDDIAFRPYDVSHDRLNWNLVSVANIGKPGQFGTFEDMRGQGSVDTNQRYTLASMKQAGVNAVRLLPIQPRVRSPYSSTAFFEVWVDYSQKGRQIRSQIEALKKQHPKPDFATQKKIDVMTSNMYRATLKSFREFVDEAHGMGIKVVMDVVRNHVGPDLAIQDIFFSDDAGQPVDVLDPEAKVARFEVRKNDPSQIAVDAEHKKAIEAKIAQAAQNGKPLSIHEVAPHLLGKYPSTKGAAHRDEAADGGWFEWKKPETWQLNHGAFRNGYHWFDKAQSPQTKATRAYFMREMAFWVLLGVDGFRIDHGTGMPHIFYQEDLNRLQSVADRYRPGTNLYLDTEDFHTHAKTKPNSDTVEQGGFRALIGAVGPEQMRAAVDASWRQNSGMDGGNHDEASAIKSFGGNHKAYARFMSLLKLFGGPSGQKMGDEFGEMSGIEFRGSGAKLWTLQNSNKVTQEISLTIARAGRAKNAIPALHHRNHHWLTRKDGQWDPSLLAFARFQDKVPGKARNLALVFANYEGDKHAAGTFDLTAESRELLDDNTRYMAFNHMADDPNRWVWKTPMTGAELKKNGVYAALAPYEVQALDIRPMTQGKDGHWSPTPIPSDDLTPTPASIGVYGD